MYRIYRNGQLEYYETQAGVDYWEKHWSEHIIAEELTKENKFLLKTLCRFNAGGGKILEAGCGVGSFLSPMVHYGYNAIGLDYALETISRLKRAAPGFELVAGDVARLPFEGRTFDGYWSVGVIEHFRGGFDGVVKECARVLREDGIAYISFPYMNLLRRLKGLLGLYKRSPDMELVFYQYVLDHKRVKNEWTKHGFDYLGHFYMFPHFKSSLFRMRFIGRLLDPFHHHGIMLVFRKR